MFKRKNESEWARFSRALTSQETTLESQEADPAPRSSQTSGAAADGPSPPLQDVNLSVSRPSRSSGLSGPDPAETLVSERSVFDGTLKTEQSLRIRGRLAGEVESQGNVLIEAPARVAAKVIGAAITVAGQVDGQIACRGRVELTSTARVTGEIVAGTLVMQEGAFFEGQLQMTSQAGQTATVAVTSKR